jgi:hypothetical protein
MASRKPRRWDLIEVVWVDAWSSHGQFTIAEALKFEAVARKSVGYFVHSTPEILVIAGTDDRGDKQAADSVLADITVIPTPWATTITVLQRAT